jgi:hypothetical protein
MNLIEEIVHLSKRADAQNHLYAALAVRVAHLEALLHAIEIGQATTFNASSRSRQRYRQEDRRTPKRCQGFRESGSSEGEGEEEVVVDRLPTRLRAVPD